MAPGLLGAETALLERGLAAAFFLAIFFVGVLLIFFSTDVAVDFLDAFFAAFLTAFDLAVFDAPAFFTRVCFSGAFFDAAFPDAPARDDACAFFTPFFLEAFFLEVFLGVAATTNSFVSCTDCRDRSAGSALSQGFRKQAKHRENQRFSFKIVGFGVARGAVDLFPHLRQPCKTGRFALALASSACSRSPIQRSTPSMNADSAIRSLPPSASPSACSSRGSTFGSVESSAAVRCCSFSASPPIKVSARATLPSAASAASASAGSSGARSAASAAARITSPVASGRSISLRQRDRIVGRIRAGA